MNIQNKFKKTNTIYKITKDMDLEGSTLIIPVGCTLDFQGGSFRNGVIEGNGTRIINSDNRYIFKDNLSTSGGFDIEELDIKWFGAKSDYSDGTGTDCSPAIERALEWSQYFYGIYIGIHGSFYLGTPIVTNKDLNLRGDRVPGKILFTEAAGNPNQNITSTIYVKPGIKAFTLKGFGDTAKLIKFNLEGIKFTSAWGISDDNTEWTGANTVLISSDTIGGPSRPGSIIGCTISNFYRVLELDSSKINKETQFYNLDIRRNSIDKCGTIFYSRTYGAQKGSGLITIENNILEQSVSVFDMSKIFGYIKICSNLLENSGNSSITLANPGNIDLIGNYWEAMHGNFSITGTDYSSVVRILQNSGGYIQASPSSQYRIILREVTLLDYDLYNMGDVTLRGVIHKVSPRIRLADIPVKTYINCAVHIPIQSVNFINPSDTFKDPKYHYASRSYIENGAINEPLVKSAFIPNSTFQNVGSIKGKLNDFVYVSFYKNAGPLTIAIYTDGGIKAGYDIATAWESGYCFIVTKINQNVGSSDSNIYVVPYNTNTQMDVQISNVNIVNLTSASIYDYNIGDIVVTTNSNGSLTNKVIQVSDVNAINFLNNNLLTGYTLNIVKDIDLQGNSIKIPANCTLDFQGGSISNGVITGSSIKNTYLRPEWFGAKGDGVTDDSVAFQMAVNLCKSTNCKVIELSESTYLIDNVIIPSNITLIGADKYKSILKSYANTLNTPILASDDIQGNNIVLRNLTIESSGIRTEYTVKILNKVGVIIDNCYFVRHTIEGDPNDYHGIFIGRKEGTETTYITKFTNNRVNQCCVTIEGTDGYIDHNEIWGIGCQSALHLVKSGNHMISNNQIVGGSVYGAIYCTGWATALKLFGNYFDGSSTIVANVPYGLNVDCNLTYCTISNNNFWHIYGTAIRVKTCIGSVFNGNIFENNDTADTGAPDILLENTQSSSVSNNSFIRANVTRTNKAPVLNITGYTSTSYEPIIISGNIMRGYLNYSSAVYTPIDSVIKSINNNSQYFEYIKNNSPYRIFTSDGEINYISSTDISADPLASRVYTYLEGGRKPRLDNLTYIDAGNMPTSGKFDFSATYNKDFKLYIGSTTQVDNSPTWLTGGVWLENYYTANGYCIQRIFSASIIYTRTCNNNVWSSWYKIEGIALT